MLTSGKGEVDQMAPEHPQHPRGAVGALVQDRQEGASTVIWLAGRGKESSVVPVTQSTVVPSAAPAHVFEHFLLTGSLVYLLPFPAWCVC